MSETQIKRLSKVAREFNVGIHTLVDFLSTKGVSIESNPNTKIGGDVYEILLKEFQSEKSVKEESKKVSIGTEKETITLEIKAKAPKTEIEEQTETLPLNEVQPEENVKVLGKIDLNKLNLKTRPDKAKKPDPKAIQQTKTPQSETQQAPEPKNIVDDKPKEPESIETKYEKLDNPKVLGKIELPVEKKN